MKTKKNLFIRLLLNDNVLYWVFTFCVFFWVLLILLAPFFQSLNFNSLAGFLYFIYSTSCHQMSSRSLFIFGEKMAVCSRCFSIYVSFLLGTLLFNFYNFRKNRIIKKRWLFIFVLPLVIDGVTQLFGFRKSNNYLRVLTGFLAGIILPFYVIPGYFALIRLLRESFGIEKEKKYK